MPTPIRSGLRNAGCVLFAILLLRRFIFVNIHLVLEVLEDQVPND